MINQMHIEDTLDDMKRILYYYFDTIDYTTYIKDLERILDKILAAKNEDAGEEEFDRLNELEERTRLYLEKMKSFQAHYKNQEEPGK